MSATIHKNEDPSLEVAGTLGELLYAAKDQVRASEQEWTALVDAIAKADQVALRELYERAHRPVFTLIMRIVQDRASAEELTLDVFHDVWRRASQYDPAVGPVLGWIMNQARSRAIDRLRFERRKKRDAGNGASESGSAHPFQLDQMADPAEGIVLREALALLTPEEKQAIETAFFSELTYAETAARLNQPLGTIKTRIRSGLSKLREMLATRVQTS